MVLCTTTAVYCTNLNGVKRFASSPRHFSASYRIDVCLYFLEGNSSVTAEISLFVKWKHTAQWQPCPVCIPGFRSSSTALATISSYLKQWR